MALVHLNRNLKRLLVNQHIKLPSAQFHSLNRVTPRVLRKNVPISKFPGQKRTYFWIFKRLTKSEARAADNPPEGFELVYRMQSDNYIRVFNCIAFAGLVFFAVTKLYTTIETGTPFPKQPQNEPSQIHGMYYNPEDEPLMIFTFALFIYVSLHVVVARFPIRIYARPDSKKYLFYYYTMLPNRMKIVSVKAGDLVHNPDRGLKLWDDYSFEHKKTGEAFIMFDHSFRRPSDLHSLLGFQPPKDNEEDHIKGPPEDH